MRWSGEILVPQPSQRERPVATVFPSGQRLHKAPTKLPQMAPNSASPDDKALVDRVLAVLEKLKAEPKNGIVAIADKAEIAKMGGNPQASFYVSFAANAYGGGFKGKDVPLLSPSPGKGTHGYFPNSTNMRSSFMMMGRNVAKGRNLGEVDMRAIAPTLAKWLGVPLPDAELQSLK